MNLCQTVAPIHLLEAFSRIGLLYFLLANVLTSAVNIIVSTIDPSATMVILIINIYMLMFSVATATLLQYYHKILVEEQIEVCAICCANQVKAVKHERPSGM